MSDTLYDICPRTFAPQDTCLPPQQNHLSRHLAPMISLGIGFRLTGCLGLYGVVGLGVRLASGARVGLSRTELVLLGFRVGSE